MAGYAEHRFAAKDGLSLYYRDYPHPSTRTPVLCIPGLTRNSHDFDFIAAHMARVRRVLTIDLRGRGQSGHDPNPANYSVPMETADVGTLLTELRLPKVIALGTSRGGVIAMTMATWMPGVLAGAILNDIGAELEPEGLERIYASMRAPADYRDWSDAVTGLKAANADQIRNVSDMRWQEFAQALYEERDGRIVGRYDPNFPKAILDGRGTNPRNDKGAADLWKWFAALQTVPTLLLRGSNSPLLSEKTAGAMQQAKPDLIAVTVNDRGHVPFLDEPEAVTAIDAFLARVA